MNHIFASYCYIDACFVAFVVLSHHCTNIIYKRAPSKPAPCYLRWNQYCDQAVSFILISWHASLFEDHSAPGLYHKQCTRKAFVKLFSQGQNRWSKLPRPIDPSKCVDPMLLFAGTDQVPSMATPQQLEHECSFTTAMDILCLVDSTDLNAVNFSEYLRGHLLMKGMQPMHEDVLLASDMVLAKYTQMERTARHSLKQMEARMEALATPRRRLADAQIKLRSLVSLCCLWPLVSCLTLSSCLTLLSLISLCCLTQVSTSTAQSDGDKCCPLGWNHQIYLPQEIRPVHEPLYGRTLLHALIVRFHLRGE